MSYRTIDLLSEGNKNTYDARFQYTSTILTSGTTESGKSDITRRIDESSDY